MPSVVPPLIAPIACWSAWDAAGSVPVDVAFVEPMQRRRLSSLARMMLHVAYACTRDVADARLVFASRHGELARTTAMLASLAAGDELSPTSFGMSVLNASAGLFSILRQNTAPATAIAAGTASFGYGLLEACLQLAERPAQPVLLVYADEPPPVVYGVRETPGSNARALGLLLDASAATRIVCDLLPSTGEASGEPQVQAFSRCIEEGRAEWFDAGYCWQWRRQS